MLHVEADEVGIVVVVGDINRHVVYIPRCPPLRSKLAAPTTERTERENREREQREQREGVGRAEKEMRMRQTPITDVSVLPYALAVCVFHSHPRVVCDPSPPPAASQTDLI